MTAIKFFDARDRLDRLAVLVTGLHIDFVGGAGDSARRLGVGA